MRESGSGKIGSERIWKTGWSYLDRHSDSPKALLQQLLRTIRRITTATVGPSRLSLHDSQARTNNVLESFHSASKSSIRAFSFFLDICNVLRLLTVSPTWLVSNKRVNVVSDKRIKILYHAFRQLDPAAVRACCESPCDCVHKPLCIYRHRHRRRDDYVPAAAAAPTAVDNNSDAAATPCSPDATIDQCHSVVDSCQVCLVAHRASTVR